jgi:hypothetical protein
MTLHFPNEEILIRRPAGPGDHLVMGNIEVEATATDASFSHEFGTEVVIDVEFAWTTFEHVSGWLPGDVDYVKPALDAWLDANKDRLERAFDKSCRS